MKYELKASHLHSAITGALAAAGTDKMLPALNAVGFKWTGGGRLEVFATDRFRAIRTVLNVDAQPGETGEDSTPFALAVDDAKDVLRMLKPLKDGLVTVEPHDGSISVDVWGGKRGLKMEDNTSVGQIPDLTSIFAGLKPYKGAYPIAKLNAAYIAALTKIGADGSAWLIQPMGSRDARTPTNFLATARSKHGFEDDNKWEYLLMGIRPSAEEIALHD